jgi:hypothetical protein
VSHRTTLSIDDDVASRIEAEVRRSGRPYRAIVNDALRRGLERGPAVAPPYRLRARSMGRRPGVEIDAVAALLDRLDGPTGP